MWRECEKQGEKEWLKILNRFTSYTRDVRGEEKLCPTNKKKKPARSRKKKGFFRFLTQGQTPWRTGSTKGFKYINRKGSG